MKAVTVSKYGDATQVEDLPKFPRVACNYPDMRYGPSHTDGFSHIFIWEFPKIMGNLLWGPYDKDPTI